MQRAAVQGKGLLHQKLSTFNFDEPHAFIEFFTANIRNWNTRAAYAQAVIQFFQWCEARGVRDLEKIKPVMIAAYVEPSTNLSVVRQN